MSKQRKTLAEEQAEVNAALRELGVAIAKELRPVLEALNALAERIGGKR